MPKLIAYQTENNGVAVVIPAPEWLAQKGNSIEECARKDVPAGEAYKILNREDFPEMDIFRDAWEIDMSNPDGYGIGHAAWFAEKGDAK